MFDALLARLGEPSTWRGIAMLLGVAGVAISPENWQIISGGAVAVIAAIEIFRRETAAGTPALQAILDALGRLEARAPEPGPAGARGVPGPRGKSGSMDPRRALAFGLVALAPMLLGGCGLFGASASSNPYAAQAILDAGYVVGAYAGAAYAGLPGAKSTVVTAACAAEPVVYAAVKAADNAVETGANTETALIEATSQSLPSLVVALAQAGTAVTAPSSNLTATQQAAQALGITLLVVDEATPVVVTVANAITSNTPATAAAWAASRELIDAARDAAHAAFALAAKCPAA